MTTLSFKFDTEDAARAALSAWQAEDGGWDLSCSLPGQQRVTGTKSVVDDEGNSISVPVYATDGFYVTIQAKSGVTPPTAALSAEEAATLTPQLAGME
jgi:hypothetical protein